MVAVGQFARWLFFGKASINYALAFGISLPTALIYLITVVFIAAMIWLFYSQLRFGTVWALALGLIAGGGASNLIDRLALNGGVADYWWLFDISTINFPDIAITIGIVIAIWKLLANHES